MAATTQLFGNLTGGKAQSGAKLIEHTALTHTGISGEGGELTLQQLPQFRYALSGLRTGGNHRKSCIAIDAGQVQSRIQIAFVDTQDHFHALVAGNCRHPIDKEGFCDRVYIGSKHHQRIHISHRRAHKAIAPGEYFFHHALALLHSDLHHVAGERCLMILAQASTAPAGHKSIRSLYIIEAA